MKQFFTLLSLLIVMGMSANVMAQNSGTAIKPHIGDEFTYRVNADLGTYVWKLTTAEDGSGDNLIGSVVTGTNGSNSIALTWANPTIGTTYFLHVAVTSGNECINRKAITIIPENNFQLDIVNVDGDNSNDLDTPYLACAPDVTGISWEGEAPLEDLAEATNFTYNYGTSVFYFRITASGINFSNTAWTADFTVAETSPETATVAVDYVTGTDDTTTPNWTAATAGVVGNNNVVVPIDNEVLFVRVTIANTTTNETLTAENITTTLLATSKENATNNEATSLNTTVTVQTVNARPNTGNIQID